MRTRALATLFILAICFPAAASKRRATSVDRCSTIVSPATLSFPATGGHAVVNVTVNGGCTWSPVASDSWIGAAPNGNQVSIDVPANSAQTPRSGLIHVRGSVIAITQDASAPPSLPNLLTNGSFDTTISGWSNIFSGPGSAVWDSGNALITSTQPGGGYQLSQCVAVTGGKTYDLGTKVFIPAGQPSGVVNFAAYEYWVPNCDFNVSYHGKTELSKAAPVGVWFDQTITRFTDFGTKSILVVIGAGGSPNPPFSARFDDVYARAR